MWAYTNCNEVELLLNGKSIGTRKKTGNEQHLVWRVPYIPGTLKAIGRKDGKEITVTDKTAGTPAKISLEPDRDKISANGKDLSFVTVKVLDKEG